MGIVIRQTIKSSFFVYLGVFVGVINRLYLYPQFMTAEQIGFVSVFFNIGMILSQIGMMGSTTTFSRFFHYFKEKNLSSVFYFLFVFTSTIGGIVCSILLLLCKQSILGFFAKDATLIETYYIYIPFLIFFITYNNVFTIFSHNSLRLTVPSLFNDFGIKLITAISILLFGLQIISFSQFIILFTTSYLIADISIFIYSIRLFKIKFSSALHLINRAEYRQLINYSLFIFVGGLSSSVTNYADTMMLSSMLGFSAAGIYSIAFFMGMVIEIPKKAIIAISTPIISKHWQNNNIHEIQKLYKQSSINQGIIGLLLLFLLWINLDEIFFLIPKKEIYSAGKYVAILIGLSKVTDMFMGINSEILRTSKHYIYDLYVTVLFIVITITTNLLLIPLFGINGAAIASLLSVIFYNILRFIIIKKMYKISPFSNKSWQLIALFTILFITYSIIHTIEPKASSYLGVLMAISIKSILYGIGTLIAIYYLQFSIELNNLIDNSFSKLLRR